MAYGHESEHRPRVRAHVVLHAARGRSNACIARETGLHLDTVRRWRGRFARGARPGSHRCRPPGQGAGLLPACQLIAESDVPLSRRSCHELTREAPRQGIVPFRSASTVRRRLVQDALKPWQHRSWIFITSPGFQLKAAWVLDPRAGTAIHIFRFPTLATHPIHNVDNPDTGFRLRRGWHRHPGAPIVVATARRCPDAAGVRASPACRAPSASMRHARSLTPPLESPCPDLCPRRLPPPSMPPLRLP
ncbi:helix-turn-helix domain-containing protein [Streptomyces sp. NPDC048384]|uniref:helix-turn-helix domain-containing protein n=1 Tax=Streptomyces sp. NPDC048384 TaxID=3155487 RepID=UPI0034416094